MKKLIILILIFGTISCKQEKAKNDIEKTLTDNLELKEIYKTDQADRQTNDMDWNEVSKKDSLRRVRVYQLLDSGKVNTSLDHHNAVMVFQHGNDSTDYGMAVKLMRKSRLNIILMCWRI